MTDDDLQARAAMLSCWTGKVEPRRMPGGLTNINFMVEDAGEKYVVRIGGDIPLHQVKRFNELAASRAAHAAGLSPKIVHAEPGVLVMRFIEGKTFGPADMRKPANLARVVDLVRRVHREVPKHLRGPALMFWVFHVLRDYAATLREGESRMAPELPRLLGLADGLESDTGQIDLVFAHNDLLAANFIDDGTRLWLVDWDYAGFNSPLFDLANLASNNEFTAELEGRMLAAYFESPPEDGLLHRFAAMKCASLLREAMWSMVQEIHSTLDSDYVAYTTENLERFERAYKDFQAM